MTRIPLSLTLMLLLILAPAASLAGEPFRFPEAKHGKGSLRYVSGIPVLTVAGTPEEIGEQAGVLALKPGAKLLTYPHELLKGIGGDLAYSLLLKSGIAMLAHFPADQRKELDAQAKASGQDRDALVVGNTMFDLKKVIACSTLVVEPERSATGGPIFGRNLDFPTCGFLQEYTLVQVCKPAGKHAFASVGFPGMLGVLSGINDAGLTVAVLEVYATADDSLRVDPMGTPYALCFRRLLEECTTVAEAEKALRGMNRTTILNLQVCDKTNAAVFEMTPKTLHVRRAIRLHQPLPHQGPGR
jgi:hypothetical protein